MRCVRGWHRMYCSFARLLTGPVQDRQEVLDKVLLSHNDYDAVNRGQGVEGVELSTRCLTRSSVTKTRSSESVSMARLNLTWGLDALVDALEPRHKVGQLYGTHNSDTSAAQVENLNPTSWEKAFCVAWSSPRQKLSHLLIQTSHKRGITWKRCLFTFPSNFFNGNLYVFTQSFAQKALFLLGYIRLHAA